jgi:SAM-dependent methyltransferase
MASTIDPPLEGGEWTKGGLKKNPYGAFKSEPYLERYEKVFCDLRHRDVRLLELGIYEGNSLLMWRDYFEQGRIAGLDINTVEVNDPSGRISIYRGMQQDCELLDRIASEVAPDGFDIIIDDASHVGALARASFWHLFPRHLKSGGVYIVEDWGTGYWPTWPDGRKYNFSAQKPTSIPKIRRRKRFETHQAGMVGFIKQLIDECGMGDATDPERGVPPLRPSTIARLEISRGQVFVFKF